MIKYGLLKKLEKIFHSQHFTVFQHSWEVLNLEGMVPFPQNFAHLCVILFDLKYISVPAASLQSLSSLQNCLESTHEFVHSKNIQG
jgi:hypothetical protein